MSQRSLTGRHLPLLAWTVIVAVLLLMPSDDSFDVDPWDWIDKPLHALVFAVHCGLLARSLAALPGRGRGLATAVLGSGLYAVLLDALQIWVPGRTWDWWDVVADLAGIALAALLIRRARARLRPTF